MTIDERLDTLIKQLTEMKAESEKRSTDDEFRYPSLERLDTLEPRLMRRLETLELRLKSLPVIEERLAVLEDRLSAVEREEEAK